MELSSIARKYFWALPTLLVAVAAFLNAQAVSMLIGTALLLDARDLARPPNVVRRSPAAPDITSRSAKASVILHRNPFDHVTGPLDAPATTESDETHVPVLADVDPWTAPACDGVNIRAIAASEDEDWSFASIAGTDGKSRLFRRGGEIAGKTVYFIGWDRVWFTNAGTLCQTSLFQKAPARPPPAAPTPSAAPPTTTPRRGAPPLGADLKRGIQAISPTEYNIDRGVVDKILENQADLMRQARIVPVQENGRVVGVRLNGVKSDALLGVLGMQNGDVLKTINGFDMASPDKALEAYARLRTAERLTIQLSRGGKDMNLDYHIK